MTAAASLHRKTSGHACSLEVETSTFASFL
jgi:hypothetical protein